MRPGRPSRFTEDVAIELVCLVEEGLSRKAAAARLGIGERTLHDWQARGRRGEPEFAFWLSMMDGAAARARRRRCLRAWERYDARAKERWQEFKRARERWWLERLGPVAFYILRLSWLAERGKWRACERLVADLKAR